MKNCRDQLYHIHAIFKPLSWHFDGNPENTAPKISWHSHGTFRADSWHFHGTFSSKSFSCHFMAFSRHPENMAPNISCHSPGTFRADSWHFRGTFSSINHIHESAMNLTFRIDGHFEMNLVVDSDLVHAKTSKNQDAKVP